MVLLSRSGDAALEVVRRAGELKRALPGSVVSSSVARFVASIGVIAIAASASGCAKAHSPPVAPSCTFEIAVREAVRAATTAPAGAVHADGPDAVSVEILSAQAGADPIGAVNVERAAPCAAFTPTTQVLGFGPGGSAYRVVGCVHGRTTTVTVSERGRTHADGDPPEAEALLRALEQGCR